MLRHHSFTLQAPFQVESGFTFPHLKVSLCTAGCPASEDIVWVCPPFPASANVFAWWPHLFGEGRYFDPKHRLIVCVDILGSGFGTTGPLHLDEHGSPYFHRFPAISLRDIAAVSELVRQHLEIPRISVLIGPSMGGALALEWAIQHPGVVSHLVLIACNAIQSPDSIAWNETQRMAIALDPTWPNSDPFAGTEGMKVARAIAVASYRGYDSYCHTQKGYDVDADCSRAASYQRHKAQEFGRRFNAYSYDRLTRAMDGHDVGRDRGGIVAALGRIQAQSTIITLSTDKRYPEREQKEMAALIPHSHWWRVETIYGHDGFLKEATQISNILDKDLMKR